MLDEPSKSRLGTALSQASSQWRQAVEHALTAQGATWLGSAGDVLGHVPATGSGQAELSGRLGLSKQAVQQFLDQLEHQGLVRREADPVDRRAKRVFLTEAGAAAITAGIAAEAATEHAFRDILGKKRFARLRRALRRIAEAG